MPRTLRNVVEHECYHVINRANSGQQVFNSTPLFLEYKALLEKYVRKYQVRIYHYVLMPNHVHLLLEPTNNDFSSFMQGVTLSHTIRANKRNQTHGHLWQGRYKSLHIDRDAYFLQCGQYIELNPVRAGFVRDPADYPWSSCRAYTQGEYDPIVTFDQFYLALGENPKERRTKYKKNLAESIMRT